MFTIVNIKTVDVQTRKRLYVSPLKMFHVSGVIRSFFKERAPNFDIFSSVVFSGRINLKQVKEQKRLQSSDSQPRLRDSHAALS